jgi:chaperonin GroEL
MLEDIAVLTGGTAMFEDLGIDLEKLEHGTSSVAPRSVSITKDDTTIIQGAASQTTSRAVSR